MTVSSRSRRLSVLGFAIVATAAVFIALAAPSVASAHPLGNFTVNRYSRISVYSDQIRVEYVLDMAEIPTFQENPNVDTNGDGNVSDSEAQVYAETKATEIGTNLALQLDGDARALGLRGSHVSFPEGQGGLQTTRLTAIFETASPAGSADLNFTDRNFSDRVGWKEVVVLSTTGAQLEGEFPTLDVSQALTSYPGDKIASPLNTSSVVFSFDAGGAGVAPTLSDIPTESKAPERAGTAFVSLINTNNITLQVILLALLAAFGFGALHAVEPGHGKTMVAAYFVGVKGTPRQALTLGLIVAVTHTIGVLAIGLVAIFGSHWILPERLYPWLNLASGVMVLALGVRLLTQRIGGRVMHRLTHLPLLGHHHHEHDHTTLAPTASGVPPWKALIAVGLADGLTPSPSALVVLLAAVSLHRIGLGIALIVSFSVGLATVLASISLGLLFFRQVVDACGQRVSTTRLPFVSRLAPAITSEGIIVRALPMTGAIALVGVGTLLTLSALGQPVIPI